MKISTRGRYGLRILLDLATHQNEGPVIMREISERQGITEKYLWQVINLLKSAGLVTSVRGAKGGYALAKSPSEVSVLEIISILEGPVVVVDCVDASENCARSSSCVTREVWKQIEDNLRKTMAGITLQDLVEKQLANDAGASFNYVI
jgi:Rrf2 family cysteine metabolism transcriptional repressor